MPKNGDSNLPGLPSQDEYEKLRREAEKLREVRGPDSRQQARAQAQGELNKYLRYTGLGLQFLAMMGVPMALGWWLDGVLNTRPWLMAVGALFGIVGAMVFVVRTVTRMEQRP